jgi:hypothetical protein
VHTIGSALLGPEKRYFVYALLLVAAGFYHFVTWPVTAADTDLWYHLAGGRYSAQTGSLPITSFFSFILPERMWANYYWLFQVFAHAIFTHNGYAGLIFLRTLVFCATALLLVAYLLKGERDKDRLFYFTILWVFAVLVLVPRGLPIRPHIFSYLLIVLFLYALEFGSTGLCCVLPLLGIFWANVHGVEYPVTCLILGAYLLESLWRLKAKGLRGPENVKNFWRPFLILCSMASLLCTPYGLRLLPVPFTSTTYVSQFIYELRPLALTDFLSFFGIVMLLALVTVASAARNRKMRMSHILLFVGGILLLLRGKRFINEFVLLSLPLLKACPPFASLAPGRRPARWFAAALGIAFMLMPFLFLHHFFVHPPRYPLSAREIPEGVISFLKSMRAEGTLLNYPNTGGYLEWSLYPAVRIFMDMQVPFLFTDADFMAARGAFTDGQTLGHLIARYRPTFISAPIDMAGFRELISKHPEYRIIFFDDTEVLYVERTQRPVLAREHGLRSVDPFALYEHGLRSQFSAPMLPELLRLRQQHPGGGLVNATLAAMYQREGRHADSLALAESIIRTYPESHLGYKLKADALAALDSCRQAIPLYKKASTRAEGAVLEDIRREESACRKRIGR